MGKINFKIAIPDNELGKFPNGTPYSEKAKALLYRQINDWDLLRNNYENLTRVETREFEFDGFKIKVQHNPSRIISTSAKVDGASIKERPCFLCLENLPEEQRAIMFNKIYLLLCNPYPIFNEHFTVPKIKHKSQSFLVNLDDFLLLAKEMGKSYVVFYNGPECGASAPDHIHFQSGTLNQMPIDDEYDVIKTTLGKTILEDEKLSIYAVENYLRKFISIESASKTEVQRALKVLVTALRKITPAIHQEPLMNILAYYINNRWRIIIFPRHKHRPSYYYSKDNNNMLVSPAAVDLGGLLITPRRKDFEKLNKDLVADIYRQVTSTTEYFEYLKKKLSESFGVNMN